MIYRSKAPLRIGLAGGGTDVSPYSELFGGSVINATISLYAHATIEPLPASRIIFQSFDKGETEEYDLDEKLSADGNLILLKGVYNSIVKDYGPIRSGFKLSTFVDAPAGSGLGTSSTLVVAVIGAFAEFLKLPLGEYDFAHYAFEIERNYLKMAGGKQDQYAATFGGINFMEFYADDKVIVNPLRIKQEYMLELEHNLLLYYTTTNRSSSQIIEQQSRNVTENNGSSIEAMHQLKQQALLMKEAVLKGKLDDLGEILNYGHNQKIKMAEAISNPLIEEIYHVAKSAGATGGKISGAGGGGYMIFYCPANSKYNVIKKLEKFDGAHRNYQFVEHGLKTWSI